LHQRGPLVYNTWLPINGIFMERDRLGKGFLIEVSIKLNKIYIVNL
jgi:hypothetical protein